MQLSAPRVLIVLLLATGLAACSATGIKFAPAGTAALAAPTPAQRAGSEIDGMIHQYAAFYKVPEDLVRRVVAKESKFNPKAHNGPYWGLMQIRHDTARSMGYDGPPEGLLDARTNLLWGVKYLRGAWLVSDGNHNRAMRFYSSGYYYDAKRKGLLEEVGLR